MLRGLKENVILGRLIPAGTGFADSKKHAEIEQLQKARTVRIAAEYEASELAAERALEASSNL